MINVKDILVDADNFDLLIKDGDFVVGYSDNQHQEHLILAYKGYYKESPLAGVGIEMYIKSAGTAGEIQREIKVELENDKYLVNTVTVNANYGVYIDANRIS
jgi:hypothetical protein